MDLGQKPPKELRGAKQNEKPLFGPNRPKGARVGKGRGSYELASPNAEEGPKGAKATIRERGPMASLRANPTTV